MRERTIAYTTDRTWVFALPDSPARAVSAGAPRSHLAGMARVSPGAAVVVRAVLGKGLARPRELEHVFRKLFQLLQDPGGEPLSAPSVESAEASCEKPGGQGSGFLLTTSSKSAGG